MIVTSGAGRWPALPILTDEDAVAQPRVEQRKYETCSRFVSGGTSPPNLVERSPSATAHDGSHYVH